MTGAAARLEIVQSPDPEPRPPVFAVPAGACDCHAHIYGTYPYRERPRYEPAPVGAPEYRTMLKALGLSRAVVVQPDIYNDNAATLDAVAASGGAWRGIARLDPTVSDTDLVRLHAGGIRGVRLDGRKGEIALEQAAAFAPRLAPLGWHLQFHLMARDLPSWAARLTGIGLPVVLDHFARIDSAAGVRQPGFLSLLDILATGTVWVKLSAPNRFADAELPYPSLRPFAHALIEARPDRLLWGSDWPHVSFAGKMPNDGDLLDLLAVWAPDRAARDAILVANPQRLYGFGSTETTEKA